MNAKHTTVFLLSVAYVLSVSAARAGEKSNVFDDSDKDTISTIRDMGQSMVKYPARTLSDLKERTNAFIKGYPGLIQRRTDDVGKKVNQLTGTSGK
jgi:hypothetical protein